MQNYEIYILGVQDRYRGAPLEKILKLQDLKFHNIWGLDATNTPVDELPAIVNQTLAKLYCGRELLPGEIACLDVHHRAYTAFSTSSRKWALVLEDDVGVIDIDLSIMDEALKLTSGPAIIQMFDKHGQVKIKETEFYNNGIKAWSLNHNSTLGHGAYAYFINQEAIAIVVKAMKNRKYCNPADWPINWASKINAFSISPEVAILLKNNFSIIHGALHRNYERSENVYVNPHIRWKVRILNLTGIMPFLFFLNGIDPLYLFKLRSQFFIHKIRRGANT